MDFFASFSSVEFLSAFIVLFAVIDPIGIMPIVLSIRDRGKIINPVKAVFFAFGLMFLFFFVGDWIVGDMPFITHRDGIISIRKLPNL